MARMIAIMAAAAALLGATGCSSESKEDSAAQAATTKAKLRFSVTSPRDDTTRSGSVEIRGQVTRGAAVRVNGKRARTPGRRFRARVALHVGVNRIRVVAQKKGAVPKRRTVTVTRKRKPRPAPVATSIPTQEPTPEPTPEAQCDPNYEGACLDPNSSDYDCEGGSGDGPDYTGTVRVVGNDHYDLDRDGDGIACDVS